MRRNLVTGWIRTLALAGSVALSLSGCGEAPPTAPAPGSAGLGGTPQLLSVAGGPVSFVRVPDGDALNAAAAGPTALTSSTSINSQLGGSLACGRFIVTIPPGALAGTGTVSMRMSDPTLAFVDLTITPNTLNDFKVPVLLTYNTTGLALTDPVTIYWYDSSRKRWVDLSARIDSKTGLPTVSLRHFSPYGAGKAGW